MAQPIASPVSATAAATVTATCFWLVDPLDASRNYQPHVTADFKRTQRAAVTFHDTLGRARPVAERDALKGEVIPLTIAFASHAELAQFKTLWESGRTLLLKSDMYEQWYGVLGPDRTVTDYTTSDKHTTRRGDITVTFTETDPP